MKLIVAVDEKWGIGKNGDLLLSIPDDMLYYRATTRGKAVVMGYTTLLSLPKSKPAPGRMNLILADIEGLRVPGAVVCGSMEQLHRMIGCFHPDDVFDIGGGSMYRQLLPYCSDAHITKMRFDGKADTYIPNLDESDGWDVADESELKDYEGLKYAFVVYHHAKPEPLPTAKYLSTDMSVYFRKKEPLEVALVDDSEYKPKLKTLLHAYFRPLENGFSADEVETYLNAEPKAFEDYLKELHLIASFDEVHAFADRFAGQGEKVTVEREDLEVIDAFADGAITAEDVIARLKK